MNTGTSVGVMTKVTPTETTEAKQPFTPTSVGVITSVSLTEITEAKQTVVPTIIGNISTNKEYSAESKKRYGGKAFSLAQLQASWCINVPKAWVIECRYCFTRPSIMFFYINQYKKSLWYGDSVTFAVRSGAPVSMPGILDTVLGVKFEDLEKAINDVWDSYNSKHAKEYREINGIPEDMGTAVIIQELINAEYSGVIFTQSTLSDECTPEFSPIMEYVEGFGDKLVGGESSGKTFDGSEPFYSQVREMARTVYETFGPSDIEWCYAKGTVYALQRRDIKFTKKATEPLKSLDGRTPIHLGKSIGYQAQTSGIVRHVGSIDPSKSNDCIIYVDEFLPSYYKTMMEAKAILCRNGGETCHAAILGRELNKIAISRVTKEAFEKIDKTKVLIDGSTGMIYEAKEEDEFQVAVKVSATNADIPNKNIGRYGNGGWDVNHLMYRFYTIINNHSIGKITTEEKDAMVREIAHLLASYFYVICVTECRHLFVHAQFGNKKSDYNLISYLQSLGIHLSNYKTDRADYFHEIKQPRSLKRTIEIVEALYATFKLIKWLGSYGGHKWGEITGILLNYLKGNTSPTLFVDICFNLQHNSGRVFNKFHWFSCNNERMSHMLNAKQASYNSLQQECLSETSMITFAEKPSILTDDDYYIEEGEDPPINYVQYCKPTESYYGCKCNYCKGVSVELNVEKKKESEEKEGCTCPFCTESEDKNEQ